MAVPGDDQAFERTRPGLLERPRHRRRRLAGADHDGAARRPVPADAPRARRAGSAAASAASNSRAETSRIALTVAACCQSASVPSRRRCPIGPCHSRCHFISSVAERPALDRRLWPDPQAAPRRAPRGGAGVRVFGRRGVTIAASLALFALAAAAPAARAAAPAAPPAPDSDVSRRPAAAPAATAPPAAQPAPPAPMRSAAAGRAASRQPPDRRPAATGRAPTRRLPMCSPSWPDGWSASSSTSRPRPRRRAGAKAAQEPPQNSPGKYARRGVPRFLWRQGRARPHPGRASPRSGRASSSTRPGSSSPTTTSSPTPTRSP